MNPSVSTFASSVLYFNDPYSSDFDRLYPSDMSYDKMKEKFNFV